MFLDALALTLKKYFYLYIIMNAIVFLCSFLLLVALVLSLFHIVSFGQVYIILSGILFVVAIIIYVFRKKMILLESTINDHSAIIRFQSGKRSTISLKNSYVFQTYDEKNDVYIVNKDLSISTLFIKKIEGDTITLWDPCVMNDGELVSIVDFSLLGYCVIEDNDMNKWILKNEDVFLEQ